MARSGLRSRWSSRTSCLDFPDLRRARTDADVAHGIAELSATARACGVHLAATRATLDADVAHGITALSASARACGVHLAATRATLDAER